MLSRLETITFVDNRQITESEFEVKVLHNAQNPAVSEHFPHYVSVVWAMGILDRPLTMVMVYDKHDLLTSNP